MRKFIKFTGKFTDLIPQGWKFWKAFARNYRVYTIRPNGSEYGQSINVWQHLGGYVEIDQLQSDSYLIIELIQSGKLKTFDDHTEHGLFSRKKGDGCYSLMIDKNNNFVEERNYSKHGSKLDGLLFLPKSEEKEEKIRQYYEQYREFILLETTVKQIQKMIELGQLEVREDVERKMFNYE